LRGELHVRDSYLQELELVSEAHARQTSVAKPPCELLAEGIASGAANETFVGDWKLNPSRSKLTDMMKVESLGRNKYTFNFGGGPETIVLDGTDQPGGFGSTLSVAAEGPGNWKVIRRRNGHMLLAAIWNLSPGGSTLTDNFTDMNPDGSTYNLNYVYRRKGGGAAFAGEWVSMSETVNSVVLTQVRPYEGDGLSFIDPSAQVTKNVKFDGKDYLNLGPNVTPGSTSSLRRSKRAHVGDDLQDQWQAPLHAADRALFRFQYLDDDQTHSGRERDEHPGV
jgi:hypothetical protein